MSQLAFYLVPVTPFQQNCSLLVDPDTRKAAIVDPGGDLPRIRRKLEELQVEAEKILVTHAHIDHAGGVGELASALNLPIEGPHRGDQFWIDRLDMQSQMFGFSKSQSFTPDRWLEDGDMVTVGSKQLKVLHCPGHTPGHVVFYQEESQLLVVGDVLFQGSIGRTDFPLGNHEQLIHAIRSKLLVLPEEVRFIPGHGPLSTIGEEKRSNPFVASSFG